MPDILESLPVYKTAEKVAESRGDDLTSLIGAYLSGYIAGVHEPRRVVRVNTVQELARSGSGHVILPADWDDPEDSVYDNA